MVEDSKCSGVHDVDIHVLYDKNFCDVQVTIAHHLSNERIKELADKLSDGLVEIVQACVA